MYHNLGNPIGGPAGLAVTGGAGALALASGVHLLWVVVACFTLLAAGLALGRLAPKRQQ